MVPDFASGVPPQSPVSSAAPSMSAFVGSAEDHFDLGYPDAVPHDLEVPLPPSLPDSFRAEIRRMYGYLVDLFPQAAGAPAIDPPPHALFEEFFTPASAPQQPIYLNWFASMRTALAETDSRLAAFLASGRPDFAFLPSRSSQCVVRGEFVQGSSAAVNPSLLALIERLLRPSLQLDLAILEAAALEVSFRAHLETLSQFMWLLSGLLAFTQLQGFQPADSTLFDILVTSLSKSLAHQASVSASHTAFVGLKHRQFFLSRLPVYFSEVNKRAMLSLCLCALILSLRSPISRGWWQTHGPRFLSAPNKRWSMWRLRALVLIAVASVLCVFQRGHPLLDVIVRSQGLPLGNPIVSALIRLLHPLHSKGHIRVFGDRGHVPRPARWGEGCLAARWEVWESWGADPWLVQVLRAGYWVPFRSRPPLSTVLLPLLSYSPSSIHGLALATAVEALQEKEAI